MHDENRVALPDLSAEQRKTLTLIYELEYKQMYKMAYAVLRNRHDAEDAVQQAFFAIAKNFEKISEIKCPQTRSFIVTIVERKAIDIYRAKNRGGVVAFDEEFINVPHTAEADSIAARADLANAMAMLPARYRELLLLKYDSGYSEQEIAEMCAMTKANVKKTIHRAKKKLEAILDGKGA